MNKYGRKLWLTVLIFVIVIGGLTYYWASKDENPATLSQESAKEATGNRERKFFQRRQQLTQVVEPHIR